MFDTELRLAKQAAYQAGQLILHVQQAGFQVEEKSKDHPVTVADRQADQLIKSILLTAFPDDGWLSEETQDDLARLQKKRVWIVDPLDGTKEFIKGQPEYCVSIALSENGRPVVGVIYNPKLDEMYFARKDFGAFMNDRPLQMSTVAILSQARILASRSETARAEWDKFKDRFHVVTSGGMAHKMTVVASGGAEGSFTLQPKTEWDFAAGDLIIHEAGGLVRQLDGEEFIYNKENPKTDGLIYSNSQIFSDLKKVMNELG